MELVKFRKKVNLRVGPQKVIVLEKDKSYIMAQAVAKQIGDIFGRECIYNQQNFENVYIKKRYSGEDLSGKKIAIWRTGGAGDLLFLSPSLKKIKLLYPTSHITLGTSTRYMNIFKYFKYVDNKIDLPMPSSILDDADYYCIFEGLIETNKDAEKINAYDIFAKRLGLLDKMTNNEKKPVIQLSDFETNWANNFIDNVKKDLKNIKGIIAVQVASSAILRTFDINKLAKAAKELAEKNYIILFMGGRNNVDQINIIIESTGNNPNMINVASSEPSWLKSAALIKKVDLVIAPDSSLAHIAGAFEKPLIGLYGPFRSDVRLKYYKNAVAIEPNAPCKPCFAHGQLPCKWVTNRGDIISRCFDPIKYETIVNIALQILERENK